MLGVLFSILAGAAMSFQGVMNTRLSERIGTMEANAFVQCGAAVLSLAALAIWHPGDFSALGETPKLYWLGGALGLVITITVMLGIRGLSPTVSISIIFIVMFAKVVGSVLPIAAEKIGVDPAVMSNPLISTLTDAVSLLIYIYVAKLVLHI